MSEPLIEQDQLPLFSRIDPTRIEPMIREILDANRQKLSDLLSQTDTYHWDDLMQPLEDMSDEFNKVWSPISHLHAVMESEELRKAYNDTMPLITAYQTELSQNEKLFHAIAAVANNDAKILNTAQCKIIENEIRDFKLSGIHLSQDKKNRIAELQIKLSELMTKFSENLLDATNAWTLHITDSKMLAGLPTQAVQLAIGNAKQRELSGYVLTLDYPSYSTAMKFLNNRELRNQIYEAYATRASDLGPNAGKWDNSPIMDQLLKVRNEMANILGFPTFAEYSLATKMAKTPYEVLFFLRELLGRSKSVARNEYDEILQIAKSQDGITQLEAWDVAYYSEKLCESTYHFSQEELRPYFPIEKVLNGMFSLVNKLYGINIKKQEGIDTWHPHVQFFSILDEKNELRGGFYIDLYARSHKRGGAWMDECRARRRNDNQNIQSPIAYLTCNFMPPVDNHPALLTHDDVLTVFHEFGHCLHHMLTKIDYPSVAGINGVPWDAVEFPSQFMENFCWEKESLTLLSEHYQTGSPLPDDLYRKMIKAKNFQTGLQMVSQIEFSIFDFRIHLEYDKNKPYFIQSTLDQVRTETSVIPVPAFNRFQHSFGHIFAGSYAAGYYSYKWAEVLSSDAYEQFEKNGVLDRKTGKSFMENILEIGGVRDPMLSFVAFRGREPTIDALLRHNGLSGESAT